MHGIEHWTHYYTDYGVGSAEEVLRLLPQGREERLGQAAAVQLNVRHPGEKFVIRHEDDWPLAAHAVDQIPSRPTRRSSTREAPRAERDVTFDALGDGVTFLTEPMTEETEITGPVAAKLLVSSSTDGRRPLPGAARVRARHEGGRVPGRARSAHADRARLAARLAPQARQEADAAVSGRITPTTRSSRSSPARSTSSTSRSCRPASSCRRAIASRLSVRGRDYVYPGGSGGKLSNMKNEFTGNGPFLHDDPRDRPLEIYGGKTTLHLGGGARISCCCRSFRRGRPISPPKRRAERKAPNQNAGASANAQPRVAPNDGKTADLPRGL